MEHAQQEQKGFPCMAKLGRRGRDSLVASVVIFMCRCRVLRASCSHQHDGMQQQTCKEAIANPHKLKAINKLHSNQKKHEHDHNSSCIA